MNTYCTLFDSNYLDKGIVLYNSLEKVEIAGFKLYVFAFDDLCYDILIKEKQKNLIVINLKDFETSELLKVKDERSRAEYCWTCTPFIIKHVLEKYKEDICTYIDADMMFFSSPSFIFEKMRANNCSVIITPHYFSDKRKDQKRMNHVGKYCVEFNTFVNNEEGLTVLNWWAQQCLKWCYYAPSKKSEWYGDQKYLNVFQQKFNGVFVCEERGAGLAPWNSWQYSFEEKQETVMMRCKVDNKIYPLVFCHFAGVSFPTEHLINAFSGISDKMLHKQIYDVYINELIQERKRLEEKYNLVLLKHRKVTKNVFVAFLQMYIIPVLHIRRLSDLYKI